MKIYFLAVVLLFTSYTYAQENIEVSYASRPLKTVFRDLGSKTGIVFSYSEQLVKDVVVSIAHGRYSLEQLLSTISAQTGLLLETVSDEQVIVRANTAEQTLCGYLTQSLDKEPLAFATISIVGENRGTISDESGYFSLTNVTKGDQIKISYVGIYSKVLDMDDFGGDCLDIEMEPRPEHLEEVVIYAYLNDGVNQNSNGSFTMVKDEIGLFPGMVEPDILQTVQFLPGIASLDESASGIQIRGGSADQNLILFDGIKMYNTGHFFGLISAFNPYVIDHATIFKSGAPSKYGDRVSGIIDISTGEEIPDAPTGGAGVNGTHADVFLKAPLGKKAGIYASARRSYTDLIKTPTFTVLSEKVFQNTRVRATDNMPLDPIEDDDDDDDGSFSSQGNENFFFQDATLKLLLEPNSGTNIHVSALYTKNDLDFSQFFGDDDDDGEEETDRFIIENKGIGFGWNGAKNNRLLYSLNGYYTSFDSNYRNAIDEDLTTLEESVRHNTVDELGLGANLSFRLSNTHKVDLGYQLSNTEVNFRLLHQEGNDDDLQDRNYDISRSGSMLTHSLYSEYHYTTRNKSLFRAGVRGSRYSDFDKLYWEPRIHLELPISNALKLKGTFEQRYQTISQLVEFEDIQLRLENHIWSLSDNVNVPVLESLQYMGGFLVHTNGWTVDIEGYQKEMEGLTSVTNGFVTTGQNNLSPGTSTVKGLDFLLDKEIDRFRVWLGYTFNDVSYLFEELQSGPFDGNNDITHNFRASLVYKLDPWLFSTGFNYRTGSPFTPVESFDPQTNEIAYGPINSMRLPDYHRMDLSALYQIGRSNKVHGEIGVSINNVYSRQVPLSVFYRLDTTNTASGENELIQVRQLSQGLTPNFVMRVYF